MFLSYTPEDGEPQRWEFQPNKIRSQEAEAIEKRTGWDWGEFGKHLLSGSVLARRALLWTYQRRVHPTLRFEDVDFATGEVILELDKEELQQQRDALADSETIGAEEKATALALLDAEIEKAPEPPGKASASSDG